MSNVMNLGHWSQIRLAESSPPSSCPIAASVFPRIHAARALMSGSVSASQNWSRISWRGAQEQKVLIGLTSLFIKNPAMAPKLNRRRALFVLTKIDEILAWEARKEAEKDIRFVDLGRYLCEVRAGQYWRVEKLASF